MHISISIIKYAFKKNKSHLDVIYKTYTSVLLTSDILVSRTRVATPLPPRRDYRNVANQKCRALRLSFAKVSSIFY